MEADTKIEYPCPVCGHDSFGDPPGSYRICSVCTWEDDQAQIRHPRMRRGANTRSIFDYQQEREGWKITNSDVRDPAWRPMFPDEAALDSGETGSVDYTLDYYRGGEPYYWRRNNKQSCMRNDQSSGVDSNS